LKPRSAGKFFVGLFLRLLPDAHPAPAQLLSDHLDNLLLFLQSDYGSLVGAMQQVRIRSCPQGAALVVQNGLQVVDQGTVFCDPGWDLDPRQPGMPIPSNVQIEEVQR
jgi:hypothetical protein